MTPDLHTTCSTAGADVVSTAAAYLRSTAADPVRLALADVLAGWDADAAAGGPDPRLMTSVVYLAGLPAAEVAADPVAYRLRVNDAIDDSSSLGRLLVAAWREVDAALFAAALK